MAFFLGIGLLQYCLGHSSLGYPNINVIFHTKLFNFNFLYMYVYILFIHKHITASSGLKQAAGYLYSYISAF